MSKISEGLTPEQAMKLLSRRYQASPEALIAVMCPLLLKLRSLDRHIFKAPDTKHLRASFTVEITSENAEVLISGRTGKFVPASFAGDSAQTWREIAKGRITEVNGLTGIASGEVYLGFGGNNRKILELALSELADDSLLEIDQYGAAAKALSGLTEFYLGQHLRKHGYDVARMPEDMAAHLGAYANYDFQIWKNGIRKRLEAKSLWGTDTRYARLIHSKTTAPRGPASEWTKQQILNYYPTSSCKFATQDFFAVSLFLRTGSITDFAFARSAPKNVLDHGLPSNSNYPEHVSQNPLCSVGDGTWFSSIDEVWGLP